MAETKVEFNRALDSVARCLALRDHSLFELKQKLSRRYDQDLIRKVMEEAESRGWLCAEADIAKRLAESLARRGKSQRYIDAQLQKRRLPKVKGDDERELASARELLVKKFGEEKLSFEDKAKAFRFLRNRGFADRWIRKAMDHE